MLALRVIASVLLVLAAFLPLYAWLELRDRAAREPEAVSPSRRAESSVV